MSKICILTTPRSGSTWLIESLSYMHGLHNNREKYLEQLMTDPDVSKLRLQDDIIFKLFTYHFHNFDVISDDMSRVVRGLCDIGVTFITLERSSILNKAISQIAQMYISRSCPGHHWYYGPNDIEMTQPNIPSIIISKADFLWEITQKMYEHSIFEQLSNKVIHVEQAYSYDNLVRNNKVEPLTSLPVVNEYIETVIKCPIDYSKIIANYDQLLEWFAQYFGTA